MVFINPILISNKIHIDLPVLLTKTSIRSYFLTAESIKFLQAFLSVASVGTTNVSAPIDSISLLSSLSLFSFLAAITTFAFCSANLRDNARPIPSEAPVINDDFIIIIFQYEFPFI